MSIKQMITMKARLAAAADEVGLEVIKLSDMRKALLQCLADAEAVIDAEVTAKTQTVKVTATKPALAAAPVTKADSGILATETVVKRAPTVKAPTVKEAPVAKAKKAKANGAKLSLRAAIVQVLGTKSMNADQVLAVLQENGWAPNAQNPRGYVAHRMCSLKDTFEPDASKGRGFYRVRRADKPTKASAEKVEQAAALTERDEDQILKEFGITPEAVDSSFDG